MSDEIDITTQKSISNSEIKKAIQQSFDNIVLMLGVLGHPNRLKILTMLLEGPQSFKTLLDETQLKKSALSSHITQLKEKSLISNPSHGQYEITSDGIGYLRILTLIFDKDSSLELSQQRIQVARSFLERKRT